MLFFIYTYYFQVLFTIALLYLIFAGWVVLRWSEFSLFRKKIFSFLVLTPLILIGIVYIHAQLTASPVDYDITCGVDDMINGNCADVSGYPPFTEDDLLFHAIDTKNQFYIDNYSPKDILKIAENELELAKKGHRPLGDDRADQIARIQSFIDIFRRRYGEEIKEDVKPTIPATTDTSWEETVDTTSLELYGSRIGMQGAVNIDTSNWKTESNQESKFSFKYPSGAKILNEGNCYRVEYVLGFVIFLLPIDGDERCGARTGVGGLPDNTDVTDKLLIQGKEYLAPGFRAVVDTKGEMFYKPETRYFYDFHHMFDVDYCFKRCLRIGYGIYKESPVPLQKVDVDKTMDSLRAIVESLKYQR